MNTSSATDTTRTSTFRYILRYAIAPGFDEQQRIEELSRFCIDSRIEEVMYFVTAEELSAGHPTADEMDDYLDLGTRLKHHLDRSGIAMSVNPWSTTYHVSRGRTLRDGQSFTLMVGESGTVSPITASPLCPVWQDWLCRFFQRIAIEINPTAIWVEDDWRLHNHDASLGWGGCFSQLMLDRMAALVGRPVTREEVLANVLASGKPHPWRALWMEVCQQAIVEPAHRLRSAIDAIAPHVRLGLMSSIPDVHSVEARNWPVLQAALATQPAFLIRPHLPPYTETRPLTTPPSVTRHTLANLTRPIEIYPELENSPRSGVYSKSAAYSIWQCFHCALMGSHGITINHYDMMGNGIALDPDFGKALADYKPQLNAIVDQSIDDRNAFGFKVLFSPRVAEFYQADHASSLNDLVNSSITWSNTAYILGIAHGFTDEIVADRSYPLAVSGQTLRAFDDAAILRLLSGPVMLDACSVEVLLDRGYADLIGISSAQWHHQDNIAFAYESIVEADASVYGLAHPRMSAQRCAMKTLEMFGCARDDVRTWIHRGDHCVLYPGAIIHRNRLGGQVVLLTYPFDGQHQFYVGYFNVFRRQWLENLLWQIAPRAELVAAVSHPLHVYAVRTHHGNIIGLLNPSFDVVHRPVVRMSTNVASTNSKIEQLAFNGTWQPVPHRWNGDSLTVDASQLPLQACILRCN